MTTVWGRRDSINVRKVMWSLGERLPLRDGRDASDSVSSSAQYAAIDSQQTVPTIHVKDGTARESNTYVRYLCRESGDRLPYSIKRSMDHFYVTAC